MKLTASFIRKSALMIVALIIVGNIGYQLGAKKVQVSVSPTPKIILEKDPPVNREINFGPFWDVWGRLETKYLDKSKLDPQKMVYGAIKGMVSSLDDPYTVFLPPKENDEYKQDLNGTFEGIGAQLGAKEDKIVVVAPLKGHPAEKAGLKAGDWIVKVDGVETFSWTVPEAVAKIRGK